MAGLGAGRFNRRVTIQRRAVIADRPGRPRGEYENVNGLVRVACAYREGTVREAALGNGLQPVVDAELRLRNSTAARTVTIADRAVIDDIGFDIVGVGLPDQNGEITIMVRRARG